MALIYNLEYIFFGGVSYFLWHRTIPSYKHIKIWGVRVYIINGRVTRNNIDYKSHYGNFTGYADTKGVILYWKKDQPFVIHRAHNFWFDKYNHRVSIEDKHNPDYLVLQQYPEIHVHNSDLLNFISCELDFTSTPFHDTTIITYEIELPTSGKKVCFNLIDYEDFTITYINNTTPKSTACHNLTTQAKQNLWIIAINGEEPIIYQGALDELNYYQNPCGKSKFKISLCRRKSYQKTDNEEIHYRFD